MGAVEYLSKLCSFTTTGTRTKSIQTVEIKVKMDCDGCERKVRNAIRRIKGVKSIDVNRKQSKVTVNGFVEPNKVLRKVKRTGKRAEFWPYIPCSAVYNPGSAQTYDRRAPPGHVKNAQQVIQPPQSTDQRLAYFFSDDNPNACSIM